MKEFERRAYQAAVIKATVVKYFLEETKPKLKDKRPEERENATKLLKRVVEQSMADFTIDELVPEKKLLKTAFEDHINELIKKTRKKVEERLKSLNETK